MSMKRPGPTTREMRTNSRIRRSVCVRGTGETSPNRGIGKLADLGPPPGFASGRDAGHAPRRAGGGVWGANLTGSDGGTGGLAGGKSGMLSGFRRFSAAR